MLKLNKRLLLVQETGEVVIAILIIGCAIGIALVIRSMVYDKRDVKKKK